jgi:hypothetical protein
MKQLARDLKDDVAAYDKLVKENDLNMEGRCTKITNKNTRCKLKKIPETLFCVRHQPDNAAKSVAVENAKKIAKEEKQSSRVNCKWFIKKPQLVTSDDGKVCSKKALPGKDYCSIHEKKNAEEQEFKILVPNEKSDEFAKSDYGLISPLTDFQDKKDVFVYSEQYCKPIGNERTLMIKSRAGSGKTSAIIRHFEKYPNLRCAYIGPIIGLIKSVTKLLEPLGFKSYLDKNIHNYDKIITSFFSLHKAGTKPFDIIVIDETEEICGQIFSSIMMQNDWVSIAEAFAWHMQRASQVICLDAALSERSYKLVEHVRTGPINVSINSRQQIPRQVVSLKYKKKHQIVATVIANIKKECAKTKETLRFAFTSADAKLAELLYKTAIKEGIKAILHIRNQPNRDLLSDVDVNWLDGTLIIYSSMVGVGIDCHIPIHTMFCYFWANMPIRTQFQMTMRFRNLQGRIILFENPRSYRTGVIKADVVACNDALLLPKSEINVEDVKEALDHTMSLIKAKKDVEINQEKFRKYSQLLQKESNNDIAWMRKQAMYNKLELAACANHYYDVMREYEKLYNWQRVTAEGDLKCVEVDPNKVEKIRKNFADITEITEEQAEKYQKLKKDGYIMLDQSEQLDKYEFMKLTSYNKKTEKEKSKLINTYNLLLGKPDFKKNLTDIIKNHKNGETAPTLRDLKLEKLKETFRKLNITDPTLPFVKIRNQKFEVFDKEWQKEQVLLYEVKMPKSTNPDLKVAHRETNFKLVKKIAKKELGMTLEQYDKDYKILKSQDGREVSLETLIGKKLDFCN